MWTRRALLRSGALALVSLGIPPRFLSRLALAEPALATGSRPQVLVPIFLRGAMDALAAVPPLDDPALAKARPRLRMGAERNAETRLFELDESFGLHPAFAPLMPFWSEGRLAVVHSVGSPDATRSHFDAQDFMETGTPGRRSTPSGWLERTVRQAGVTGSPFQAVAMALERPRSLAGELGALAIEDLESLRLDLPHGSVHAARLARDLAALYDRDAAADLKRQSLELREALRRMSQEEITTYRRQRADLYPDTPLGRSLLQVAYLIKARVGLQVAAVEHEGWDTHVAQGAGEGRFAQRADDLATALRAFWDDLEGYHDEVLVMTMTEFGRTVHENGSGGTDHGHGSCLFLLGNRVAGGKVHGRLPPLTPENLFEGRDLPVTTDFRAVFSEVASKLFGVGNKPGPGHPEGALFPGWSGNPTSVLW